MATETTIKQAPTKEIGTTLPNALPSWAGLGIFGGNTVGMSELEYVPELRWPQSVRITFPRMATDSQMKALERGTILPITRYAWGIDPNGASPEMVAAACADFNLPLLDDALETIRTGRSQIPLARAQNRFSWHRHLAQLLKAIRYGHYPFEQVGAIADDGRKWGAPQDQFWHLTKLAPRPPRSLSDIRVANDGGLMWIRQRNSILSDPPIDVARLVYYVWDPEEDPGDWLGTSMYRSCYREWLIKDRLLRVDAQNHENAGGKVMPTAPQDATPAEREAMAAAADKASKPLGGSVAWPFGTDLTFVRGTGSDVIASINRHDEAMSRAWMMMVIQLASTAHGSRAVGNNFESLLGIFQEGIAGWACDTFNEHVVEDWADWNYGPDTEYVPRLAFFRPENFDPSQNLDPETQQLVNNDPAVKAAIAEATANSRSRASGGDGAARAQKTSSPSARAAASLPDRPLRREPFEHEVRAAVDFKQLDTNWQSQVDQLVGQWQAIRSAQIAELQDAIVAAGGDLSILATIAADAAGGDLIAARLKAMATLGSAEAIGEAARQGAAAVPPDLAALEAELLARSSALEVLLANALSQAAANRAVQLTGGALTAEEVAGQVGDYLGGLTDTYLADQFSGALSAAQNGARLATMAHNGASKIYASELLDTNTCEPCEAEDGTEFGSAEEAAAAYPAGGYSGCLGGTRCRGTLVGVYDETEPS